MNRTIEEPASLEHVPGIENLTDAELAQLANNDGLREEVREVFRWELSWRRLQQAIAPQAVQPDRVFEVECRACANRSEVSLSLPTGLKLPAGFLFTCKKCTGDRSVLDAPNEIKRALGRKLPGQQRRMYEVLASTRASQGPYIVEYPNGHFGYQEGGYKPYRRKNVKQTARKWRESQPPGRDAEYKRRYRMGDRRQQFRAVPVDAGTANAALEAKLKEFGYVCSTPGCGQPLTVKTAIRSADGLGHIPICASCRGRKAANTRWAKEKKGQK